MAPMLERIFHPAALGVLAAMAGLGIAISLAVGLARGESAGRVLKRLRRLHRQSVSRYHAFGWLLYHQWL